MHRAGSRFWTNEIQHGIPPLPTLRNGQGQNGLCLLRHCLQSKENVLKNGKTDQKWRKYAQIRSIFAYFSDYTPRESKILGKSPKIGRLNIFALSIAIYRKSVSNNLFLIHPQCLGRLWRTAHIAWKQQYVNGESFLEGIY